MTSSNNFASPSQTAWMAHQICKMICELAPDKAHKARLIKSYEEILIQKGELQVLRYFTYLLNRGVLYGKWPWPVEPEHEPEQAHDTFTG